MTDFLAENDIAAAMASAWTGAAGCVQDINKSALAVTANQMSSLWAQTGLPAAGATPTAWAAPTAATQGAWAPKLVNAAGKTLRLLLTDLTFSLAGIGLVVCDRVGHMGGLSGTVTTAQTVNASLTAPAADGRCNANGADVLWFLEWYGATGTTTVNATVAVTYSDNSTGNIMVTLAASMALYRVLPIIPTTNLTIKAVGTVTLNATTGTAGNFGVSAYKRLASSYSPSANYRDKQDWAFLGFPNIGNNACLSALVIPSGASAGTIQGNMIVGAA